MVTESSSSKSYPILLSPGGRPHIALTPDGKNPENVIYEIQTEKGPYVGRTKGALGDRMSGHQSCLRAESDLPKAKVYRVINECLLQQKLVTVRILETVSPSKDLHARERHWIAEKDAVKNGLNGNKGSKKPAKKQEKPPTPFVPPTQITPQKEYPLKRKAGRVSVDLTASAKKIKGAVAYRFKKTDTDERYIGQTGRFGQRVSEHISLANTGRSQKRFHRELSEHPERFTVGVIQETHPGHLDELESHLIKATDSYENGYNGNRGRRKKPKLQEIPK